MTRARLAAAALALVSAGCALGPKYRRPSTPATATFRGLDRAEAASFADLPWWQVLRDPSLTALIGEALQNSYDLQDAIARVEVARQNANVATDALLPSLGVQAGAAYQQVFLGSLSNLSGLPNVPRGNVRYPSYQLLGSISWEADLWGRLRRQRESALAQVLAAEENRRGVVVSLIGEIAQAYFDLLALDLQLAVARRTVESRQQTLALFREREVGGVGSALDTASEQALLAGARATVPSLERQIVETENRIAFLVGRPPGPIRRGRDLAQQSVPADPPVGLPAALLERRPDVRQAEAQVVSANAQVGAALAAILPGVGVTGNVGLQSSSLSRLFTSNALTFLVSGVMNAVVPVLNGAQNVHRYRAQEAAFASAVASYRRTVLAALLEVADALVELQTFRAQRAELEAQVAAQVESVRLAKERFRSGVASYLDVVQAEQNLFPTELLLAQTIGAQFSALTQLYRALGGGWR